MNGEVPENVYRGELVNYNGPWGFDIQRPHLILVSDRELEIVSDDPDGVIETTLTRQKESANLRTVCEQAKARGQRTLVIAFDHFFAQYRGGQEAPRRLTVDKDEYIQRIARISRFCAQYGIGLELSILNPLEIGPAYRAQTGETGRWLHYRKGLRDPGTGAFSVQLWQQQAWVNNKGIFQIADAGVRVFAFREEPIRGTPYRVVNPDSIVEVTAQAEVECYDGLTAPGNNYRARRIRIHGRGAVAAQHSGDLNRVLVIQQYDSPEMDYFSEKAPRFLKALVDKYIDAGVKLNGLYSDEMHIQQDWCYDRHHDNGEFALRYVSDGLASEFARRYGARYRDFAKYLLYFVYGQEDTANDVLAKDGVMHVFGASPQAIRETALFRAQYYHLLQDGVTDLCVAAKRYAESRIGYRLQARAHATWAESPTCDYWRTGQENGNKLKYEYTSSFVWSNTVHQAAAACQDFFKWGEYLTGNGNDHAEGGWLDRDYFGIALACSTGILNDVPNSYAAYWGGPAEVAARHKAVTDAFGVDPSPAHGMVQDREHRDVAVLMLYPLDLVAVDERFGSWMTQYGYANMVTPDKLLERGTVVDGAIEMAGRRFTTLAAVFEPFPKQALLALMKDFVEGGGRLVWSGPPPVLTYEGQDALAAWQDLFGVDYQSGQNEGLMAPGRVIRFEGPLAAVRSEVILTDFLVDRIYPVIPRPGTAVAGRTKGDVVATHCQANKGTATFLGFRPRDDQAASLGYETRQWFDILVALGAYPASGAFPGVNDNPEYVSRSGDLAACRFPNGAVSLAPHYHAIEEGWPGGFARDREQDEAWVKTHTLPAEEVRLAGFKVSGHTVDYVGQGTVSFRVDAQGNLAAFAGQGCTGITVDGRVFAFASESLGQIAFAPVRADRCVPGGAQFEFLISGRGEVRLPTAVDLVDAAEDRVADFH